MRYFVYYFALGLVFCFTTFADHILPQDTTSLPQDSVCASLTVTSLGNPFDVYLDTVFLGAAPLREIPLSCGRHILQYRSSQTNSWYLSSQAETLTVTPGAVINRSLQLPVFFRLDSEPFGAEVWINDSLYGTTPFFFSSQKQIIPCELRKVGYEPAAILLTAENPSGRLILQPHSGTASLSSPYLMDNVNSKNQFPVYATAVLTVAAGATAALFKIKADNHYADYQKTGDGGSLDKVHLYDNVSGVSLVVSELSFLAFSYFLFSR